MSCCSPLGPGAVPGNAADPFALAVASELDQTIALFTPTQIASSSTAEPAVLLDCSAMDAGTPYGLAIDPLGRYIATSDFSRAVRIFQPFATGAANLRTLWTYASGGSNGPIGFWGQAPQALRFLAAGVSTPRLAYELVNPAFSVSGIINGFYSFNEGSALAQPYDRNVAVQTFVGPTIPEETGGEFMAIDDLGRVAVTRYGIDVVQWWDLSGNPAVALVAAAVRFAGTNWNIGCNGIAFDAAGNVFVSGYDSNVIQVVLQANIASGNPVPDAVLTPSGMQGPSGLRFDWAGNLWLASYDNAQVQVIAAADTLTTGSPTPQRVFTLGGALSSVIDIALWPAYGPQR